MTCVPAAACRAALHQASELFPQRSTLSDGICASAQHHQQNPNSDHETGDAWDLTHDPAHGCDVDVLFARIVERRDPRVKYLIRNKRMVRSYDKPGIPAWTWAPYDGPNPHIHHGHCSILPDARAKVDAWFNPGTQPQPEDEDMAHKIWRPVGAGSPNVGGEYIELGDTFIILSADEKQQLANSEASGDPAKLHVQDAQPELWKRITQDYTKVVT